MASGRQTTGREATQAAMRYVTGRWKSEGAVVAHLLGLGYQDAIAIGVVDTLVKRHIVLRDAYGRIRIDPQLMEWKKVRGGVTRDGRSWWRRWNGERFEQVLSERPTQPNPPSIGAKRASAEGKWIRPRSRKRVTRQSLEEWS